MGSGSACETCFYTGYLRGFEAGIGRVFNCTSVNVTKVYQQFRAESRDDDALMVFVGVVLALAMVGGLVWRFRKDRQPTAARQ